MHVFELDPSLRVNGIMGKNHSLLFIKLCSIFVHDKTHCNLWVATGVAEVFHFGCMMSRALFIDLIMNPSRYWLLFLENTIICRASTVSCINWICQHNMLNGSNCFSHGLWTFLLTLLSFCWWQFYMQNFTTKIVNLMKSENLYASQGGPIILSQVKAVNWNSPFISCHFWPSKIGLYADWEWVQKRRSSFSWERAALCKVGS